MSFCVTNKEIRFNYLLTCHHSILCCDMASHRIVHVPYQLCASSNQYVPMLLVWNMDINEGHLLCHSENPKDYFNVEGFGSKPLPLLAVAIQPIDRAIALRLKQHETAFGSALPIQGADSVGEIVWDSVVANKQESFSLCALNPYFFSDRQAYRSAVCGADFLATLVAGWIASGLLASDHPFKALLALKEIPLQEKILGLYSNRLFDQARKMAIEEQIDYSDKPGIDLVIATLKNDQAKIDSLCMGNNFWHPYLLPTETSPSPEPLWQCRQPITVGKEFDFLSLRTFFGIDNVDPVDIANNFPGSHLVRRLQRQTQQGIGVLATFRNEGPWILEWVAHYRMLGFDRIIIYSNNNQDGSDELLEALAKGGIITWCNNICSETALPQMKAYGHALNFLEEAISLEWLLIVDADEFLIFDDGLTLQDFIKLPDITRADAIAIHWKVFGTSGHKEKTSGLVMARFTQVQKEYNHHIKTMFRPNKVLGSGCHRPMFVNDRDVLFVNASGDLYEAFYIQGLTKGFTKKPSGSRAHINHYITKSEEECLIKRRRGYGNGNLSFLNINNFLQGAKFCEQQDLSAHKYLEGTAREMARLTQQCGLAPALAGIENAYENTLAEIKQMITAEAQEYFQYTA